MPVSRFTRKHMSKCLFLFLFFIQLISSFCCYRNNSTRRFEPFWANNTALLNSTFQSNIIGENVAKSIGIIFVEIPLATRHLTRINYGYTVD